MTTQGEGSGGRTPHEYCVVTAPGVIRFERVLPGPIERVWAYLTESDKRGKWLAKGRMDLRVGGSVALEFRHADLSPQTEVVPEKYKKYQEGATTRGRITACDPPRVLGYTGGEEQGPDTEVTFALSPRGQDVLLVLTHRLLEDPDSTRSVAGGWHTHLGILTDVLAGRTPLPFWTTHARLENEYERRLAR